MTAQLRRSCSLAVFLAFSTVFISYPSQAVEIFSLNSGRVLARNPFPIGPHAELTPGSVCHHPSEIRYPEKISYCERSVATSLKAQIIKIYDSKLGYRVGSMPREEFKIDHYIPLCAGGSNDQDNLWPQHKSVYAVTDPIEPLICQKMSEGKLLQKDAIKLIRIAKNVLQNAPDIIAKLKTL